MAELIREIVIDATPETIWPFLTEAGKHVEWNGTVAEIDPRPGGIHRVLIGGQHQSAGEFVEVVPKEKVVFTFGWEEKDHPIPPGSTTIEITLHPEGERRAFASSTAVFRPTQLTITARVGRITSSDWRSRRRAPIPVPTSSPTSRDDRPRGRYAGRGAAGSAHPRCRRIRCGRPRVDLALAQSAPTLR